MRVGTGWHVTTIAVPKYHCFRHSRLSPLWPWPLLSPLPSRTSFLLVSQRNAILRVQNVLSFWIWPLLNLANNRKCSWGVRLYVWTWSRTHTMWRCKVRQLPIVLVVTYATHLEDRDSYCAQFRNPGKGLGSNVGYTIKGQCCSNTIARQQFLEPGSTHTRI